MEEFKQRVLFLTRVLYNKDEEDALKEWKKKELEGFYNFVVLGDYRPNEDITIEVFIKDYKDELQYLIDTFVYIDYKDIINMCFNLVKSALNETKEFDSIDDYQFEDSDEEYEEDNEFFVGEIKVVGNSSHNKQIAKELQSMLIERYGADRASQVIWSQGSFDEPRLKQDFLIIAKLIDNEGMDALVKEESNKVLQRVKVKEQMSYIEARLSHFARMAFGYAVSQNMDFDDVEAMLINAINEINKLEKEKYDVERKNILSLLLKNKKGKNKHS